MKTFTALAAVSFAFLSAANAALDTAKIEQLTGLKGKQTEDVFKVSAPRSDVKVAIEAIHQHMTHEQPRMMFLHYWGRGKATELARALKDALALSKSTPTKQLRSVSPKRVNGLFSCRRLIRD